MSSGGRRHSTNLVELQPGSPRNILAAPAAAAATGSDVGALGQRMGRVEERLEALATQVALGQQQLLEELRAALKTGPA